MHLQQFDSVKIGDKTGLPEDLGSSLAVGLDRRWGQCRFGEVLGSMGRQRLISHQKVHQGTKRQRGDGERRTLRFST